MNLRPRWALGGIAAAVAALAAALVLIPDAEVSEWVGNLGYVVGAAVGGAMALVGSRRAVGSARRAWGLITAAQASWVVGLCIWTWYESVLERPVPSLAAFDVFYGLGYALLLVGLAILVAPRLRAASPMRALLDVLLVVAAVFYVAWSLLLGDLPGLDWSAERAITWVYPSFDVTLACIVLLGLSRAPRLMRARWLALAAGVLMLAIGDSVWAYTNLHGQFASGSVLDALWFGGYLVLGFASLCGPSTLESGDAVVSERWTVLVPYVPVGLVLLASAKDAGEPRDPVQLTVGILVVALLCIRQVAAVLENQRLARDLEARVAARTEELAASEALFRAVGEQISDAVVVLGPDMMVRYVSPGLERIAGYGGEELLGRGALRLVHPDDQADVLVLIDDVRSHPGANETMRCRVVRGDGTYGHTEITVANMLDHPDVAGHLLVVRDMSAQRELEDRLRYRAEHDSLTDLANRAALVDALDLRLGAGERPAVVLLDLDGFKGLNDSLGHAAGDELLRAVAARLRSAVRPSDVVARLGGDEFAVVVDGDAEEAHRVATRIIELLDEPVATVGRAARCRASVGVTTIGNTADELLRNADLAMYEAKAAGRHRVEVFEDRLHRRLVRRMKLEEALAGAVDRGDLELAYQPLVGLGTGELLGAEALLRWRHDGEDIAPTEFIPLAEDTGLVVPIGRWVLHEACAAAAVWYRARPDGPLPRVAVNVSAVQLGSGQLVVDVSDALSASGLPPSCLTIEITESAVMERSDDIVARLGALRSVGVRVSIDDFGTGHSSLGRLRFLPVDEVKIDRSFVSSDPDGVDEAVVDAVLALAGSLGLDVVAEGIETADQREALRSRGCEAGQGWLFGRPAEAAAIHELLLQLDNGALNFSV